MLTLHHLTLHIGSDVLLKDASFCVHAHKKIGLVGKNGIGKSMLLRAIASRGNLAKLPEPVSLEGSIVFEGSMAYVPQEWREPENVTVSEFLGENTYRVPKDIRACRLSDLSGGWHKLVQLAAAFATNADLLLLDEPTNNLDEKHLEIFVRLIMESTSAVMLVSHDRDILDKTVTAVLEIDAFSHEVTRYAGNYSHYTQEKETEIAAHEQAFEAQRKRRKRIVTSINRLEGQARAIEAETVHFYFRKRATKVARRVVHQRKRLESELSEIEHPEHPLPIRFDVRNADHPLRETIILARRIAFEYESSPIISDCSLAVRAGDRILVRGSNGSGKSTLLALFAKRLSPCEGSVDHVGTVGYLPQALDVDYPDERVTDFLMRTTGIDASAVGTMLGGIFGQNPTHMHVRDRSEGDLKKLMFASLFANGCRALVLDEPTNHLDIHAIEALERAVNEFTGGIVLASHDKTFVKAIGVSETITLPMNSEGT